MQESEKSVNNTKQTIPMEGLIHFKERLKKAMGEMNNLDLARKSGVSESVIRSYLAGKSYPGLDKLIALSDACECSLEWLARGALSEYKHPNLANVTLNKASDSLSYLLSNLSNEESLILQTFIIREGINGLLRLTLNNSHIIDDILEDAIDNLPIRTTLKQAFKEAAKGDEHLDQEILRRIEERKNTDTSSQLNQNENHSKVG